MGSVNNWVNLKGNEDQKQMANPGISGFFFHQIKKI